MTSKFASSKVDAARHEWVQLVTATGNRTADLTSPIIPCGWARTAIVRIDLTGFTRTDANETLDIYIQTTYNGGTDWSDVENIQRTAAGAVIRLAVIGMPQSSAVARIETAGALAGNTKLDLPLGTHLRVVFDLTDPGGTADTYAVNVEVFLQA